MRVPQRHIRVRVRRASDDGQSSEEITVNDDPLAVQLDVSLQTTMSISPDANQASVMISNLAKDRRQKLAGVVARSLDIGVADIDTPVTFRITDLGDGVNAQSVWDSGDSYVEIDAGYDSSAARVFQGSTQFARNYKSGPTWVTEMQIGDGLSTMMTGVVARTFAPGASAFEVVDHMRRVMGLGVGNVTNANLSSLFRGAKTTFPFGWTAFGDAKFMMSEVLTPFNIEWFVDRGEMFVVRKNEALPQEPATVDFASGLLTTPEPIEQNRLRIRTILRPDIRICRRVIVSGVEFAGTYRSEVVTHSATNRLGGAITEVILSPL